MFKRANKITSLLVAAASVATMVPAYAADVKKVDSQDGTVYGAIAYKDGTALIDAEISDTDAAYFLKDGKYTALDSIDSGSDYAAYGSKYAKVDDGSDYNVDLEAGKVLDSDVPGDTEDDAASALRKEIKDSDRYADVNSTTNKVFGDASIADLTILPGTKFGDTWYAAKYGAQTPAQSAMTTDGSKYFNIYTDVKGNYIDADYNLGKIKVETTDKSVTIENTKDTYDLVSNDQASAKVTAATVLGQDKDNIYRFANIQVTLVDGATYGTVKINNKAFTVTADSTTPANGVVVLPVIQKISKTQDSDDVDDGKYSKSVYNYVISGDSVDSTSKVMKAGSALTSGDAFDFYTLVDDYANNTDTDVKYGAEVIGGKLAVYKVDNSAAKDDNVLVQAVTLKQSNGYYYTDAEAKTTLTAEYSTDLNKAAFDTDVDGNIYGVDGGYIKKFDGTDDWTKIYKVDGSFDALSAYDKDNMVVWSQGDEVYSVIGGKTKDDDKTTDTTTTTPAAAGWAKNTDGSWSFNKADGTKATGWFQDTTGTWYYANTAGVMAANAWAQDSTGAWYYLGGSGAMTVNAWVQSGGKYYYVGANGAMLVNTTTPDGYWVGADGAWV